MISWEMLFKQQLCVSTKIHNKSHSCFLMSSLKARVYGFQPAAITLALIAEVINDRSGKHYALSRSGQTL